MLIVSQDLLLHDKASFSGDHHFASIVCGVVCGPQHRAVFPRVFDVGVHPIDAPRLEELKTDIVKRLIPRSH